MAGGWSWGRYVTYIRNVSGLHWDTPGRALCRFLVDIRAVQVFQSGLSARSQAIGQMASPGIWVPFQKPLPSKPFEVAVKGAPVGNWPKQVAHIVRS